MPASANPDLPETTADMVLRLALVRANVRFIEKHFSKREAREYLDEIADGLGVQEAAMNVLRFRAQTESAATVRAVREARAWWGIARAAVERLAR